MNEFDPVVRPGGQHGHNPRRTKQLAGLKDGLYSARRIEALLEQLDGDQPQQTEPVPHPSGKSESELRDELFRDGSEFAPASRPHIVGIDNILGEIEEIIHWLRNSKEYGKYSSRLQPGVIFAGSPGTGKTLVSRWIATESNAVFINVRDFVHGTALFMDSDIRDLFNRSRARYKATGEPVVLFWDEFENSAIERGGGQATPEQRSVVSQLTAELDGIHGKNEGLLLIGCTNYLSEIDDALMRRGRMGVQIEFHPPDRAGKERILRYYLEQKACEEDIDLDTLSYFFPKHNTAADIEEACVEAWRNAVRRFLTEPEGQSDGPELNSADLIKVFIKQLVGPPTTFTIPAEERLTIAIHECGHAIVALVYDVPLRLITVQPGKKSLGRIMVDDLREYVGTVPETIDHMRMGLGGVAAERTAGLPAMTGAADDIAKASQKAQFLVDELSAGARTGLLNITALERSAGYATVMPALGEKVLADSDADVRALVQQAERDANGTLIAVGRTNLLRIAEKVNERVTMTGKQFTELFIEVCGDEPHAFRPLPTTR